jgi:excisionase family DNA binding protein
MSNYNTATPKESRQLVTSVAGACHALSCGRDRLYSLLGSGEIESYTDGRSRKIVVASIESYIARRLEASKQFERARYPARRPDGEIIQRGIGAKQPGA